MFIDKNQVVSLDMVGDDYIIINHMSGINQYHVGGIKNLEIKRDIEKYLSNQSENIIDTYSIWANVVSLLIKDKLEIKESLDHIREKFYNDPEYEDSIFSKTILDVFKDTKIILVDLPIYYATECFEHLTYVVKEQNVLMNIGIDSYYPLSAL